MGQKLASKQLNDSTNHADRRLKKYTHVNYNINTAAGDYLICEIYMPSVAIWQGIVLAGIWTGGGGNTASNQHYKHEFVAQIYPYGGAAGYKITQSRSAAGQKLQLWSLAANPNLFRFTMDAQTSYKSWDMIFWEHPVQDYYSNPKGIKLGDQRVLADMTGWTLRRTGP